MAPWEEIQYFLTPRVTLKAGGSSVWNLLVPANPNRVSLWFSTQTGQSNFSPDNTLPSSTSGLFQSGAGTPIIIREADDGPLCTCAWYYANMTGPVTAIEILLREFPECNQ
jgi:hypothetical protein